MPNKIARTLIFIILTFTTFSLLNITQLKAQEKSKGVRTIYLIRHGEYSSPYKNAPDSLLVLTPLGIAQARLVATRLKSMNINFTSLISSTMTRAEQTTEVISQDFPELKPELTDLIRECILPTWREDIMAGTDSAETGNCISNIEKAFKKYFIPSPDNNGRNDIIVCHGNVIRYLVTRVLKVDTKSWLQMGITNCSLTIIRILPDGTMKLDAFSDYGHIPENMRTFTGGKNESKKLLIKE